MVFRALGVMFAWWILVPLLRRLAALWNLDRWFFPHVTVGAWLEARRWQSGQRCPVLSAPSWLSAVGEVSPVLL